ncbi:MAG: efflux RND transporter permease subunit [Elainellaceae cyanobacterium]
MVKPTPRSSVRERFNFSRWTIQHPWLTLSFWIAVSVAGIFAFSSLKYGLFPDITFPVVVVNASAPLSTALDTEQTLTEPIEQELQDLDNVTNVNSTTYPGRSVVSLRFEVGTDLEASTEAVEAAMDELSLPAAASFEVLPINLNEAVVASYAIESETLDLAELAETAEADVVPAIEELPGVLRVDLLGVPRAAGAAPSPLTTELAQPGQSQTRVRFNGQSALAVQIVKRSDANTLEVVRHIEQRVEQLATELPEVQLTLAATQADFIQASIRGTIQALIEAIVLSIVIIFPFLRSWRATFISALAIPTSLLGTFIIMAIYGFNLEMITLLALALVIGNLVDDAIVDVENVVRHIEQGESPRQAAIRSTNEIGLAVVATTAVAIAVFLPVGTMQGVLGQFFKPFGITISASLIISTLVARTLSPALAGMWLKPRAVQSEVPDAPDRAEQQPSSRLLRGYRHSLDWALRHRGIVIGVALLSFVAGLALIPLIPKGFIPKLDRGEFNITYTAPLPEIPQNLQDLQDLQAAQALTSQSARRAAQAPSLSIPNPLEESLQVAKELDEFVLQSPDVEKVLTIVGSRQGEPNKGTLYVKLRDDRSLTTTELQEQFRAELPEIDGVSTSIEDIQFVDTGGEKPVQVGIEGNDLALLNQTAQEIRDRLATIPGFEDATVTGSANQGDEVFEINRADGQRIVTISANLGQELTIGEATDRAVAEAQSLLPTGVSLRLGGDSARVDEILGSFGQTLVLSLFCIVLVLLLLFRSIKDSLVIFLSLPLSIVGAMLGLLIAQSDFGMISLIGIIFLLGLTNKNAILIVDYINQLRQSGMSRRQAILEAVPVRLRPIMMTTASTILGMVPIALSAKAGGELRSPMAVAIIGGLMTSTLLSLLVVPVIYDLLDGLQSRLKKKF